MSSLKTSIITPINSRNYRRFNPEIYSRLTTLARKIKGAEIIHINAAPLGGGVAEILKSQVALEQSLGLKSRWLTISAPTHFFKITKKIHNLLHGKQGGLTAKEKEIYLSINSEISRSLRDMVYHPRGIIVVHDPQPLPIIHSIPKGFISILRLHTDLLTPNYQTLEFLRPFIFGYHKVILSNNDYLPAFRWLKSAKLKIIPPAIDPLSEKNQTMDTETAHRILERFSINCTKPIVTQISRFDPWKDPLGVLRAYYLAKNKIPNLQLVLAGFAVAQDDPEAASQFMAVKKHAAGDPDIFLFADIEKLKDVSNDTFINALQVASTVILQKSIREGFGLTITEAMWKEKAVIAGKTSGAMIQIKNTRNGILVSSPEETARAIVRLTKNVKLRERIGRAAKRSVQKKFLISRYLLRNFQVYAQLLRHN